MNYITVYQLDINGGFQCKVNGKTFNCTFEWSSSKKQYYVSNILNVADAMEIPRQEFIGIFNSDYINHVIYCNSKQQCYDLCQYIVDQYFMPNCFTKNDEEFTVEISGNKHTFFLTKNEMFYWDSKTIKAFHFNDHISLTAIANICNILNINKYKHHNNKIGFETKEDAIKFAKYVIQYHYPRKETKEWNEKSRRYLAKYYADDSYRINLPERSFSLRRYNVSTWYWHNNNLADPSNCIYSQFKVSKGQALEICNKLNLKCILHATVPTFENTNDAIKFTDYLIETYIIKKEKTYDTNQLRKERTSISRGAKPTGNIIHGRRSKASVRCGCVKHQTCFGY